MRRESQEAVWLEGREAGRAWWADTSAGPGEAAKWEHEENHNMDIFIRLLVNCILGFYQNPYGDKPENYLEPGTLATVFKLPPWGVGSSPCETMERISLCLEGKVIISPLLIFSLLSDTTAPVPFPSTYPQALPSASALPPPRCSVFTPPPIGNTTSLFRPPGEPLFRTSHTPPPRGAVGLWGKAVAPSSELGAGVHTPLSVWFPHPVLVTCLSSRPQA